MAITRRQFIKRTGLVGAGTFLGPQLFNRLLLRKALADIETRYFVVIFLDGGNDGLNTVVPMGNGTGTLRDDYDDHRRTDGGGINLSPTALMPTQIGNNPAGDNAPLALHPGFIGLKNLYTLGKVAVIQGCGYPSYSLSHEESRAIWQNADPLGMGYGLGTGWVGRYLASAYGSGDIPAVNIQNSIAGEFKQTTTSVLTIDRLNDFGFPYDFYNFFTDQAYKRQAFLDLCIQSQGSPLSTLQYIGSSGEATLGASEAYGVNPPAEQSQLHQDYVADRGTFSTAYGNAGRVARDLREVAKIIYGVERSVSDVNARFFQISNGGYDTHSDQGGAEPTGQQYNLHKLVGDALEIFYADLEDMGAIDRTCVLVWSEFSRRILQNDNGTDHGSQGPMFVIGGSVVGGVYGNHPNIAESALDDQGNSVYQQDSDHFMTAAFRSTDFRDVYGTVFQRWLKLSPAEVAALLPPDAGDPTYRWTVPNFDMGFLPILP